MFIIPFKLDFKGTWNRCLIYSIKIRIIEAITRKEIIKTIFIVIVVIITIFNIADYVVSIKDLNMIDVAYANQIKIAYTEKYKPLKS